jgi:hypothetical protein
MPERLFRQRAIPERPSDARLERGQAAFILRRRGGLLRAVRRLLGAGQFNAPV